MNDIIHRFAITVTLYSERILNAITTKLIYKKLRNLCATLKCSKQRNDELNRNLQSNKDPAKVGAVTTLLIVL